MDKGLFTRLQQPVANSFSRPTPGPAAPGPSGGRLAAMKAAFQSQYKSQVYCVNIKFSTRHNNHGFNSFAVAPTTYRLHLRSQTPAQLGIMEIDP